MIIIEAYCLCETGDCVSIVLVTYILSFSPLLAGNMYNMMAFITHVVHS